MILGVAGELFLERGYEGVSIDAITASVGGSKRDLYALFEDKETLFRRAVKKLTTERADLVREVPLSGSVRTALTSIGLRMLEVLLSPRTLALHRLMISEAARASEAAETFLQNGPKAGYELVAQLLRYHAAMGSIRIQDADHSARIFVDGLTGDLQLRALLGEFIDSIEQQRKVDAVVAHFLEGVSASQTATGLSEAKQSTAD